MPFTPRWTLLPIFVALAGYWWLVRHTLVSGHWVVPAMLTASVALLVLALNFAWSVALRRERFTRTAPSSWRDGQAVAFEARLQRGVAPLFAPATGTECALYHWRMQRSDGKRRKVYGEGVALANATVIGPTGPVRLFGLPNPVDLPTVIVNDTERLARFAKHLLGGPVDLPDDLSPAPGLMPRSFTDEQVQAIEARLDERSDAEEPMRFEFARPRETSLDHTFGDAVLPWTAARAQVLAGAAEAGAQQFAQAMRSRLCVYVVESALPVGAPVCVFGTWKAGPQHVLIDAREDSAATRVGNGVLVNGLKQARNQRRFRLIGGGLEDWVRRGRWIAATLIVLSLIPLLATHYVAWRWLAPGFSATPYPARVLTPGEVRRWQDGDGGVVTQLLGTIRAGRGRHTPDDAERMHLLRGLLAYDVDLSRPGASPLLQNARLAELRLLLEHGADPDVSGPLGSSTALHAAAWSADAARIDILLRAGADPARKNSEGWTPLQIAVARASDSDAGLDPEQSQRAIALLRDAGQSR